VRRVIWIGVGVAGAVMVTRWLRKQRRRYGPANVADRLGEMAVDLGHLLAASVEEGRRGMAEREAQIRAALDEGRPIPDEAPRQP
jgi:hypothetical protein